MAKEVGIVMSLYDRVSPMLKTISGNTKAFDKSLDELETSLKAYDEAQKTMSEDVIKLKQALSSSNEKVREAQKDYRKLKDETSRGALNDAIREQEELKQALNETERALKAHSKEYDDLYDKTRKFALGVRDAEDQLSKAENRAGGLEGSLASGLKNAGLTKMLGDAASEMAGTMIESALGQPMASFAGSVASGAATGAAAGAILGPTGALVGAGIGALAGGISGASRVFGQQDDAFKAYVQDSYETVTQAQADSLTSGSSIAAGRETDRISFATLFGDKGIADTYLANLVEMSNNTPFLYGDLTAMSKTLATFQYGVDEILPVLQTIGDAGAALGMSTSDMTMVATAIGRMKSSNRADRQVLDILNDRGIGVYNMLAEAKGVSQEDMDDMISKGKISGREAASIILQAMTDSFAGSMEEHSKTFAGLTSTVTGLTQELDNAMGEGYNQVRMPGLQAQRDWLSGESGEAMQDAYSMIGQWKASLENTKEQLERDALDAVMTGTIADSFADSKQRDRLSELAKEYQDALTEYENGNEEAGAKMGRLLAEAQVIAMSEYNDSDGAQMALENEKALIAAIRNDASLNNDYWQAGYEKGNEFTKGLAAARMENYRADYAPTDRRVGGAYYMSRYATGIDYVPYDNFPALLHQGERVQTAVEARSERSGPIIHIEMNGTVIREYADVDRLTSDLVQKLELASMRG